MNDDYSQPAFYRFNSDSIALIDWICKKKSQAKSIMDLGAGCGIIGLELARRIKTEKLVMVELQSEYLDHLQENCRRFLHGDVEVEMRMTSFGELKVTQVFDLIVSNPPYYLAQSGQLSKDPNRAKARAFLVDNWRIFLQKISSSLASEGSAFLVLKNNNHLLQMVEFEATHAGLQTAKSIIKDVVIMELLALNKE
jgi:tRNA1(Val) A37 N6-methylase TrmN6